MLLTVRWSQIFSMDRYTRAWVHRAFFGLYAFFLFRDINTAACLSRGSIVSGGYHFFGVHTTYYTRTCLLGFSTGLTHTMPIHTN